MIVISCNFIFSFIIFCAMVSFLIKLLTLGILFQIVVIVVAVAKLVVLDVLFLTSFI